MLATQFPILEDALVALGVAVWPMVELEADDAHGLGRARSPEPTRGSIGCSSARPTRTWRSAWRTRVVAQLDRRREGTVIDEAGVRAKFGVSPGSIPD